jgi:hypothetical protein
MQMFAKCKKNTSFSKKLEETTTELQVVSRALEKEKGKTEALLNEILPRSVAEALKEGKEVPASK